MKMSHLATFLLIVMGGAVQQVGDSVRRGLQRSPRPSEPQQRG
ncbi:MULTISPECIES: hypothetical protein [Rhodoplanes]|jgi:hypothetical protein|uniref:Uncharacterized protein n=1 Tax=Rhodoplanes serenus TaxID=200615 RepID=A0A3S4BY84_9BRAD|nr:hypothetical protein [Rhodoplanes serenus]VCU10435.1 hypothetical protein RHODGE_RHODGE_04031 [Rhodoplanes serenus]